MAVQTTLKNSVKAFFLVAFVITLSACSKPANNSPTSLTPPTKPRPEVEILVPATADNEKLKSFFSPNDNLEEEQFNHFSQAQHSIDLAIYTFSSRKVRDLLHSKAMGGVRVRIVINKGSGDSKQEFLAPLIEAGARVRVVSTVMHHKFSIVDGRVLANSSANMGGSKDYDENLVICTECPTRTKAFQQEFEALFTFSNPLNGPSDSTKLPDGTKGLPVHRNYTELALFTTSNFTPKISPTTNKISLVASRLDNGIGRVDSALADALSKAKTEVKIATGHFRSKPLYDAVVAAVGRGVKVTLVLDGQEYISESNQRKQDSEIETCKVSKPEWECYKTGSYFSRLLMNAGAEVILKYYSYRWHFPFSKQMHHKYMIIDGHTLYSGSYNWSYNAEYETTENVAVYSGESAKELIQSFENNFAQLLSYGGGVDSLDQRVEEIRTSTTPIPLHFESVSLRVNQIDQLLAAAREKCPTMYKNGPSARFCPGF